MSQSNVAITQINIVARHFDATLKFYRLLGLDIPEPIDQPPGALHAPADAAGGVPLEIDNEHLGGIYNAGVRSGRTRPGSAIIGVTLQTREQVDAVYATLVSAGYEGRQPPYDAFWGSRYAIVADPEGNDVGLMSPSEEAHRSWPPADSPAP